MLLKYISDEIMHIFAKKTVKSFVTFFMKYSESNKISVFFML